jgi:RNA polymerase sigma-70 factor (ECF subfamily)
MARGLPKFVDVAVADQANVLARVVRNHRAGVIEGARAVEAEEAEIGRDEDGAKYEEEGKPSYEKAGNAYDVVVVLKATAHGHSLEKALTDSTWGTVLQEVGQTRAANRGEIRGGRRRWWASSRETGENFPQPIWGRREAGRGWSETPPATGGRPYNPGIVSPEAGDSAPRRFQTTRWTLVVAAGDRESPEAETALSALCTAYWHPVYAFIRRSGHDAEAARDLTQGFFTRVLEKNYFGDARRERGRFRTFLLTSVRNFLANERDRDRAQKRGGGRVPIPLEADDGERSYQIDPSHDLTPERLFEQRWALAVIGGALNSVRERYELRKKAEWFANLKPFLTGNEPGSYADLAAELKVSEGSLRVAGRPARDRRRDGRRARRHRQGTPIPAQGRRAVAAVTVGTGCFRSGSDASRWRPGDDRGCPPLSPVQGAVGAPSR